MTEVEQKFFNSHQSNDPVINKIIEFVRGENIKYDFVNQLTKRVGFPYWDKSVVLGKAAGSGRGLSDTSYTVYVPFARDSQYFVNSSLIVNCNATDTTFEFLYDWQYSDRNHGALTDSTSAESIALKFMILDQKVFGHNEHRIRNFSLFYNVIPMINSPMRNVKITPVITGKSALLLYQESYEVCFYSYTCGTPAVCEDNCDYLEPCPFCPINSSYCQTTTFTWYDDGGGGSGSGGSGSGGGGSGSGSGSGWNNPCIGAVAYRGQVQEGCSTTSPGWSPASSLQAAYFAWDNSIVIDPTLRQCLLDIFNQVRNINQGQIAQMISIFAQELPSFNWTIVEAATIPVAPNASAITTVPNNSTYPVPATTTMNWSVIQNATQASIARTYLHEAVHAFIFAYILNRRNITPAEKALIMSMPFGPALKEFMRKSMPLAPQHSITQWPNFL